MEITKKKAKELSIKKWTYITNNDGLIDEGLYRAVPEIRKLNYSCGLCEIYVCKNCPIYIDGNSCADVGHPWYVWEKDQSRESAQVLLDLIKKS